MKLKWTLSYGLWSWIQTQTCWVANTYVICLSNATKRKGHFHNSHGNELNTPTLNSILSESSTCFLSGYYNCGMVVYTNRAWNLTLLENWIFYNTTLPRYLKSKQFMQPIDCILLIWEIKRWWFKYSQWSANTTSIDRMPHRDQSELPVLYQVSLPKA